ncbi:terpene synthase family protein [Streptomyces yaizuensis]|uniref:Terpene synthase n=1 Tax=Streptomyces yaizuensis TaxID=2989713 RepID=A0ABQ5P347_9ACTN|nr:pentalenene synthase [Streptomyces sp. YSPA8]GLF97023.1 pentalenene synthase [Streptomyces sp. YSPA8]
MPHVEFHVPFEKRDNPDLPAVRAHNLAWLEHFGLVVGEQAQRQYLKAGVADFCSMAHPGARGEDLDAVVDAWSWTVFPDDLFDGPAGRDPGTVTRVCRRFAAIVDDWPRTRPDPGNPMETALHDMWGRLTAGMPASWVRHRGRLWTAFIMSQADEAGNRDRGHPPALDDYLPMRRVTIAVRPTLLVERVGRFQVPGAITTHPLWRRLHDRWIDVVSHVNDVYSLEKDESFGEVSNIVLVLEHHQRLTRDRAIRTVQDLVQAKTTELQRLQDTLRDPRGHPAGLTPADRDGIDRYLTGIGDYTAANYHYSRHVPRYTPHGGTTSQRLSYVQHLRAHL